MSFSRNRLGVTVQTKQQVNKATQHNPGLGTILPSLVVKAWGINFRKGKKENILEKKKKGALSLRKTKRKMMMK